ncbi:MAG: DUF1674 domain-containing protein [Pseudomonadota bacterium]|nr:DUF1674 domain-containing protein [Pseudomonadota bacterium]
MARIQDSGFGIQEKKREGGKAPPDRPSPESPDYTRYGDWQIKGKCVDF